MCHVNQHQSQNSNGLCSSRTRGSQCFFVVLNDWQQIRGVVKVTPMIPNGEQNNERKEFSDRLHATWQRHQWRCISGQHQ